MELRPYQQTALDNIRGAYQAGKRAPLLCSPTGSGKCFGRGTPVLLFDGRVRPIETIMIGDLLMGPDSRPRRVVSLAHGLDDLFRVSPTKGDPYIVNRPHILSLKMTGGSKRSCGIEAGTVINLTVDDYLSATATFRHCAKGWRAPVRFPDHAEPLRLPAYFVGAWLGDWSSDGAAITTADREVEAYIKEYAASLGLQVRDEVKGLKNKAKTYYLTTGERGKGPYHRTNPVTLALDQYGMLGDKHVPQRYLTASWDDRLELLAGILDSDGHWTGAGYELTLKNERLMDGIIFLARSLGFSAYKAACQKTCGNNGVVGSYWRCTINGPVDTIPCRIERKRAEPRTQIKDPLMTGVSVESIGRGEYFGFELDGPDRLFLLGDFTVAHNSAMTKYMLGRTKKSVLYLCHRAELADMIHEDLRASGLPHGMITASSAALPNTYRLHVGMMQTVARRIDRLPRFDWVISDEAHLAMSPTWSGILKHYSDSRHLGMSATPCRLDGKGLGEIYDAIVYGPSVRELMDRGYLTRCRAFAPAIPMDGIKRTAGEYQMGDAARVLDTSTITGDAIREYAKRMPGRRAIVFCCTREHADHVAGQFRMAGIAAANVDGSMTKAERAARIADFRDGRMPILTNVDLLTTGFDMPSIGGAIFLRPTQSLALYLQMVGRILRIAPGKEEALILDHVGNVLRHGLPDSHPEWTLDGKAARPTAPAVRQCPECFAAFHPARACPECGYVFPIEAARKAKKEVAGELVEVGNSTVERYQHWLVNAPLQEVMRGRHTLDQIEEVRRARGYHHRWSEHQLKYRGRSAA